MSAPWLVTVHLIGIVCPSTTAVLGAVALETVRSGKLESSVRVSSSSNKTNRPRFAAFDRRGIALPRFESDHVPDTCGMREKPCGVAMMQSPSERSSHTTIHLCI